MHIRSISKQIVPAQASHLDGLSLINAIIGTIGNLVAVATDIRDLFCKECE